MKQAPLLVSGVPPRGPAEVGGRPAAVEAGGLQAQWVPNQGCGKRACTPGPSPPAQRPSAPLAHAPDQHPEQRAQGALLTQSCVSGACWVQPCAPGWACTPGRLGRGEGSARSWKGVGPGVLQGGLSHRCFWLLMVGARCSGPRGALPRRQRPPSGSAGLTVPRGRPQAADTPQGAPRGTPGLSSCGPWLPMAPRSRPLPSSASPGPGPTWLCSGTGPAGETGGSPPTSEPL